MGLAMMAGLGLVRSIVVVIIIIAVVVVAAAATAAPEASPTRPVDQSYVPNHEHVTDQECDRPAPHKPILQC